MTKRSSPGFTIVELLVVVTIIGILAAVSIPQYVKTMETSKSDDAAALVQMIAVANRMYASDNSMTYVNGPMTTAGVGGCTSLTSCPPA